MKKLLLPDECEEFDWMELIKTCLVGLLLIGLLMLIFAPFMWR